MDSFVLRFPPETQLSDDEFFAFCAANADLRIERDNKGQLIVMSPTGGKTGNIHFRIYHQLSIWMEANTNLGYGFDSSTGFKLPDKSVLAPDAAFVSKARWENLTSEQQRKFPPLCPDFIIEVRSDSDSFPQLQSKMKNWIDNGCRLAWLIDPTEQKAYVYKPSAEMVTVNDFNKQLHGEDVLPGFVLHLSRLV